MASYKAPLVLLVLALAPGCEKKSTSPEAKPPASAAADADGGAAAAAEATAPEGQPARAGEDPAAAQAAAGEAPAGGAGAKVPPVPAIAKPAKVQVLTISMGERDLDVRIAPAQTAWRISMKPTAGELAPIAARAKASPEAEEGAAYVAVGNSVPPEVGQAMAEALKSAGFKKVEVSLARRP